jgi:glutamate synthase (NADPH/NADH) large chain
VIVLGDTGLNFGAGMSGGMAFVVDEAGDFVSKTNKEMVELTRITSDETEPYRVFLKAQIARHLELTGSARAKALLADFDGTLAKVWLVKPKRISIEDLVEDLPGQSREAVEA